MNEKERERGRERERKRKLEQNLNFSRYSLHANFGLEVFDCP